MGGSRPYCGSFIYILADCPGVIIGSNLPLLECCGGNV